MNIEEQIRKTKNITEGQNVSSEQVVNQLILENQLVILETLKELSKKIIKRDRSQFGPG